MLTLPGTVHDIHMYIYVKNLILNFVQQLQREEDIQSAGEELAKLLQINNSLQEKQTAMKGELADLKKVSFGLQNCACNFGPR